MFVHKKVRNVRHDWRVALSLLGDKTNAEGLREYVVIYGNARVTDGGAVNLLQRLARIYLGANADQRTLPLFDDTLGYAAAKAAPINYSKGLS